MVLGQVPGAEGEVVPEQVPGAEEAVAPEQEPEELGEVELVLAQEAQGAVEREQVLEVEVPGQVLGVEAQAAALEALEV